MQITDEEIVFAEKILIPDKKFTAEHINFIRNFNTSDIVACPGSGKTTSLLAKLIILSLRMPFSDGRGICVLTHTNIGIDEIKNKLGNKCDILFKHPNFFGTIQSFVDTFLAIPYFKLKTGRAPASIDNDRYIDLLNKLLFCYNKKVPEKDRNLINNYIFANSKNKYGNNLEKIRFQRNGDDLFLVNDLNGQLFEIKKTRSGEYSDAEKEKIENWIINKKNYILLTAGVLHYDDAYFLANEYLYEFPIIKSAFQNRFKYVYIDEMQDTAKHQNDLINSIFTNPSVVVQKIGDPNQAIFDFHPEEDEVWVPQNGIPINISQRFHNNIAKMLKTVCICNNTNLQTSSANSVIPPYIITYTDETITSVIEKFCEIINQHCIKNVSDRKIKAIGWRGKDTAEPGQICLKSYFPEYFKSIQNKKNHFNYLISYLGKKHQSQTVKSYFESIIEGIVRALTLSKVRYNINGLNLSFTRSTLMSYLKDNNYDFYILFRNKIAIWAKRIFQSKNEYIPDIFNEIKTFILDDISKHVDGFDASKSTAFLNGMSPELPITSIVKNNTFSTERYPGVDVEISTVHAVKGETHAATLYLETHFYGTECESLKIIDQFKGIPYNPPKKSNDKRRKQCLKMAYVGMSRPTHLLCVAMHKDRIDSHLADLKKAGWEIEDAGNLKKSKSDSQ